MQATVIDTLRYAVRLKEAGVEPAHAEAMPRALNDELTEGLATKADLDSAVTGLNARFDAVDARFDAVDARFDALGKQVGIQGRYMFLVLAVIVALAPPNASPTARRSAPAPTALGLRALKRHCRAVLRRRLLGLYNATVPLLLGKGSQPTGPSQPTPTTAAMMDGRPAELRSSGASDGYLHGRTRTGVPAVADR